MTIVYIDAQNLYLGTKKLGWVLDYAKLYIYLKRKYQPNEIKLFIGYLKQYQSLYASLTNMGYTLVYKQTSLKKDGSIKGNVDINIALAFSEDYYVRGLDTMILVSSDCDFVSLLEKCNIYNVAWHLIVPNGQEASYLLKNYCKGIYTDIANLSYFFKKEKSDIRSDFSGDHDVPL